MKKVTVTYHAPPHDSKAVEAFGHTFFDGKSEEIEVDDRTLAKMQGNRHFECGEPSDVKDGKRDTTRDKAAAEAARRDDAAKYAAQETARPPLRGAVNPNPPPEDTDDHKSRDDGNPKGGGGQAGEADKPKAHQTAHR
jgi:hypothetical protein